MIQRSQDMRFPLEARHALGVAGEHFRQNLERHVPIELGVGGAIDHSHAARTELCGDAIMRNGFTDHNDMAIRRYARGDDAILLRTGKQVKLFQPAGIRGGEVSPPPGFPAQGKNGNSFRISASSGWLPYSVNS